MIPPIVLPRRPLPTRRWTSALRVHSQSIRREVALLKVFGVTNLAVTPSAPEACQRTYRAMIGEISPLRSKPLRTGPDRQRKLALRPAYDSCLRPSRSQSRRGPPNTPTCVSPSHLSLRQRNSLFPPPYTALVGRGFLTFFSLLNVSVPSPLNSCRSNQC